VIVRIGDGLGGIGQGFPNFGLTARLPSNLPTANHQPKDTKRIALKRTAAASRPNFEESSTPERLRLHCALELLVLAGVFHCSVIPSPVVADGFKLPTTG
jgi:hypothetical protein